MKKLSLFALAVLTIIIYSCMQDYPNEPPVGFLKISNPYSDDTFAVGDTVLIQADAVMMNLSRIEFYVDGVLKGSDSNKPYTCEWMTAGFSASKHEVKAISYSADGSLTQSIDIKLINGIAPELSISEPSDNSSFKIGTALNILALASDADGTVSDVKFYINDVLHSTLTATPYKTTWNTTGYSEGTYIVKVVAKDNMKIVTTKQIAINLYLKLPECLLTYPVNNAVYLYGQTVKIKAKATENKKSITKLNFFVDNVLIHSTTTPDSGSYYFYNWNTQNQTSKNHQLRAVAVDHNGKESTSNIVNVILNKAPTANITNPVNSSNVALNAIVPVAVTAADSDGTISEVKFYVDGVEKAVDNSAPYNYDWLAVPAGSRKIKAIVKDNNGSLSESTEITVIVHNPTLATVTTAAVTNVTTTTAKSGGTVTSDEYSPVSARGVCWSTSGLPSANGSYTTDGSGNGSFISDITGLTNGVRYIVRAYATNGAGTSYGDTISFKTLGIFGMVFVEGGSFQMGNYSVSEATPVHSVNISSFYIAKYEVKQTEWIATIGSNPSFNTEDLNRPVEMISWYDIMIYCNKRSIVENLTPCYAINGTTNPNNWGTVPTDVNNATWDDVICNWSANGYRLPTEAEWEFSARGGNYSQDYTYSGSNIIANVAWYITNSNNTTHIGGTKLSNELNLYDMTGNVFEWSWDWFGNYSTGAQTNPVGAITGSSRVFRGGSFISDAVNCHVASRGSYNPYKKSKIIGFRLARSGLLFKN